MRKIRLLTLMIAALLTGACVYDFNANVAGSDNILVIEGDILIGDYTNVRVSTSSALTGTMSTETLWDVTTTVEASDGTSYTGHTTVDTRSADPSLEYRLVVKTSRGTYVSEWAPVLVSGPIDSLSYVISDDRTTMTIEVTAHGDDTNRYYRWIADQTWEYHTPYMASHYYVPRWTIIDGVEIPRDSVMKYKDGENHYYCWNSSQVDNVMIASSADLSENRIVRHPLFSMDRYEQRISYIYSVLLTQEAISETAWRYWDMLVKNSSDVGGLFSPEPYEMRGNIINEANPDEMVLGYVSVTAPSKLRYFIDAETTGFPRVHHEDYDYEPVYVSREMWREYYRKGYDVYMLHSDEGAGTGRESELDYEFDWLPNRCVYCELWGGGHKNKPSYWPNDHK